MRAVGSFLAVLMSPKIRGEEMSENTEERVTFLALSVGTSRGAETYGWTIVRLRDEITGSTYRTMGGGYDMQGTVLAEWMQDTHAADLLAIKSRAHSTYTLGAGYCSTADRSALYGMSYMTDTDRVQLDGACGVSSIIRIGEAIGLEIRQTRNGFLVTKR